MPAAGDVPVARYADRSVGPEEAATLATAMPFDVVIGSCNPVAPPIEVDLRAAQGDRAGRCSPRPTKGLPAVCTAQ